MTSAEKGWALYDNFFCNLGKNLKKLIKTEEDFTANEKAVKEEEVKYVKYLPSMNEINLFVSEEYPNLDSFIQLYLDELEINFDDDIVYPYSDEQIIENISSTFQYILQYNPAAKLFFLLVANTNGRLDRSNKRINQLNTKLKTAFTGVVRVIDIHELNDEFGDLKSDYTIDGLHFSSAGYERLQQIVENAIRRSL